MINTVGHALLNTGVALGVFPRAAATVLHGISIYRWRSKTAVRVLVGARRMRIDVGTGMAGIFRHMQHGVGSGNCTFV